MNVIDFRVRPPFKSYMDCEVYDTEAMENWAARFGVPLGESARQKSLDLFWKEADAAGIRKVVTAGNLRKPKGVDNADVDAFAALYPDRVLAAPCVNLHKIAEALNEVTRYVVKGHCRAIMMEPGYLDEPLRADDRRIYPLYEYCQQEKIPVLLSIGGFCGPNLAFNDPMQVDNVAADFPNLRIAVCHAFWPYAAEACHVAMNREHVYLSPDMYVFNCPSADEYIAGCNYLVPDKMLFGSAYPIFSMEEAVKFYTRCGVLENRFDALFYANATRFFTL